MDKLMSDGDDIDAGRAIHGQFTCRRQGKIDDPVPMVWAPVIDGYHNLLAIGKIGNLDLAPEGQFGMGRGEGVLIEDLATGGLLAMEARSVPGGLTHLTPFRKRTTAGDQCQTDQPGDRGHLQLALPQVPARGLKNPFSRRSP